MTEKERYEKQIRPQLQTALTSGIIHGDMKSYLGMFKNEYIESRAEMKIISRGGCVDIDFRRTNGETFNFSFRILQ